MSAGKNGGNYISGSDMLTNNVDLVDQISVILIFIKLLKVTLNKNMNTEENTLQCDLCQKDFTCFYKLTLHKGTHNREKPFQCSL